MLSYLGIFQALISGLLIWVAGNLTLVAESVAVSAAAHGADPDREARKRTDHGEIGEADDDFEKEITPPPPPPPLLSFIFCPVSSSSSFVFSSFPCPFSSL